VSPLLLKFLCVKLNLIIIIIMKIYNKWKGGIELKTSMIHLILAKIILTT
jgi:hypothetical protein